MNIGCKLKNVDLYIKNISALSRIKSKLNTKILKQHLK